MKKPIRRGAAFLFRFLALWFIDTLSIAFTARLLPSVNLAPMDGSTWVTAAAAAFVLGIVNLLVRPLILLLALPLGFFVMFAIGFIVNALTLLITAALLPALQIDSFGAAFLGGLFMAAINTIVTSVITIDDDDSFFQGLAERIAARTKFEDTTAGTRGLVMLEIDGLSYSHMKQALESGLMPETQRLVEEYGYQLSHVDCGIPSQTSACQAGIMFGDNFDIPAFRWYDKGRGKTFVSGKDAPEINARYATGKGLMRGGTSINNMMNGDAENSLLTLADLRTGTAEQKKRRARDIYLLMVNPYFIMRTFVLLIGEAIVEVWQYLQDKRRNVEPRLNRLKHLYPLVRGATTVFMRDVAEYLITLDIVRGSPSIYTTWPGYDEVAHHTGPSTDHAMKALAKYDKTIARLADVIRQKAPRPYDLIILSDHGQSFGATFLQRYGVNLKGFIEQHLPAGCAVAHSAGGDDGTIAMAATAGELENMAQQGLGGTVGEAVAKSGQKALEAGMKQSQKGTTTATAEAPAVTVFGSGNLAPVYFHFSDKRVTRNELELTYPGLFSALVEHEGVGVVLAYENDGTAVAWGKSGSRWLHSGVVDGVDPLLPYGDPEVRAGQLRRLAEFPNNGDLTVFSTVYPDGTVAAMEELIGSHGGMGGAQTDAFILHPNDLAVPATTNSADVFHILDARRGTPAVGQLLQPAQVAGDDWAPTNLGAGIRKVGSWLGLAGRALRLDSSAYREVVRDPLMTGPALLIGVAASFMAGLVQSGGFDLGTTLQTLLRWLVFTLVIYGAGRVLTNKQRRIKRSAGVSYTQVFRGLGFAQSTLAFELLAIIPVLAPFARLLSTVMSVVAAWIATAVAHDLHGWRAIAVPIVAILVFVSVIAVVNLLLQGAVLSLESIAQQLGLAP